MWGRDFDGEQRRNDTHEGTTGPQTKLKRKAAGNEAKLCFGGPAFMDKRYGLMTAVPVTTSVGATGPDAALALIARERRERLRLKSVGATKRVPHGTLPKRFAAKAHRRPRRVRRGLQCRARPRRARVARLSLRPDRAQVRRAAVRPGQDGRGVRKTRLKGVARSAHLTSLTGAAYNPLRIDR
jgi:hypothetical protein